MCAKWRVFQVTKARHVRGALGDFDSQRVQKRRRLRRHARQRQMINDLLEEQVLRCVVQLGPQDGEAVPCFEPVWPGSHLGRGKVERQDPKNLHQIVDRQSGRSRFHFGQETSIELGTHITHIAMGDQKDVAVYGNHAYPLSLDITSSSVSSGGFWASSSWICRHIASARRKDFRIVRGPVYPHMPIVRRESLFSDRRRRLRQLALDAPHFVNRHAAIPAARQPFQPDHAAALPVAQRVGMDAELLGRLFQGQVVCLAFHGPPRHCSICRNCTIWQVICQYRK